MKLIANFMVMIEDGEANVDFSMKEAECVNVNTLLILSKFFSDVEKKAKITMGKINAPNTAAETAPESTDNENPNPDNSDFDEEGTTSVEKDVIMEGGAT